MTETMRTRLNLMLTAAVAFAVGLMVTAPLDFTPQGVARDANPPLVMDVREPGPRAEQSGTLTGFSEVAAQITPAVVTIEVEREIDTSRIPLRIPLDEDPVAPGSGSGFIISEDGYIVTNNHVVQDARSIEVLLADGRRFDDVRLVGRDATTDVALLKIDGPDLVHAPVGSSAEARVGDWVLAIGSPGFGRSGSSLYTTVTAGIISAKGRSINILQRQSNLAIEDFIQTDAAINRGNSGGPLVNARGEVIGVNTAIASSSGSYEGYGFAVPIDLVQEVVQDLVEFGTVNRAILGIGVREADDADSRWYGLDQVGGAVVVNVREDAPAREAEIEIGDVIVAVEGQRVLSVSDLQREIREYDPGETVTVEFVDRDDRERKSRSVELISADEDSDLAGAPEVMVEPAANEDPLGIQVEELDAEWRSRLALPRDVEGVVVSGSDSSGALARRFGRGTIGDNLRGLVITDVNREPMTSVDDYRDAVEDLRPGDVVSLMLLVPGTTQGADPATMPLTVPIPSR